MHLREPKWHSRSRGLQFLFHPRSQGNIRCRPRSRLRPPTKVLLLCPASSKDGKAVADSRNADAGSSSEIRTGKIESAVFSQRRETSVPNLKAMPRKSSLARRHSQTLSNTEKRAHFSEAPIIELVG
ncbi:hypothetical protein MRX96_024292 [Rhipicephalus microplus]